MRKLSELVRNFKKATQEYIELNRQTPRILGDIAVKETQRNFHMQGFVGDGGYKLWKSRKASTNKSYNKRYGVKGSVFNSRNPILKQTGNLYDNIKYVVSGKRVDIGVNPNLVPYAKAHNEGYRKLPKRQWIGFSKRLANRFDKDLKERRKRIFSRI